MNIVMFTNTYAPHVGGVARSVGRFETAFRERGHRVLVVAPVFEDQPSDEPDVVRVPALLDINETGFSFALPPPPAVSRAVRTFGPDVVHTHHPFVLGDTALRIARMLDTPIVLTHHTLYERYVHVLGLERAPSAEIASSIATEYANQCEYVIAPTESIRELIINRGVATPVTVIPTGVDLGEYRDGDGGRARRRLGIPADAVVVGHVGRLSKEKNLCFLAEAMAEALADVGHAVVLVVGAGREGGAMQRILSARLSDERLVFAGALEGQDLVDAYHAMDVFAFASKSETQGMVLAEAMACGIPVVGLDAPGTRDIVRDGENGALVKTETVEAFGKTLRSTVDAEREERATLSQGARQTAENWSTERCADRYLNLYEEVCKTYRAAHAESGRWNPGRGILEIARLWGKRIAAGIKVLVGAGP